MACYLPDCGVGQFPGNEESSDGFNFMERKRATRQELADRIEKARQLLSERRPKGEVKRELATAYGVTSKMAEIYISRARRELVKETQKSALEHKTDAYGFYLSVVGNVDESTRERLRAQECIDKLLALPGSIKIAHTNDNEIPEASSEARAAFDQLLAKLRNRAAAAPAT